MQTSDIPTKLPIPFASGAGGAYIRTIPVPSQIGILDGAVSWTDGFVPLNATPIAAGGIPPDIKDINGTLFEISGWARWVAAGGPVSYDATYSTAINGYPAGAFLQSATTPGLFWVSTTNNNVTNPDAGGAGWTSLLPVPATQADLIAGADNTRFVTAATLRAILASTAEIIAGTDNVKYISPAALAGIRASNAEVLAGTDPAKYVTPASLAASNSVGIIHHAGGLVQQYGTHYQTYAEGSFLLAFNTPFLIAVDAVPSIVVLNQSGGTLTSSDAWAQWRPNLTSLTNLGFVIQNSTGGAHIDGVSWSAWGR